MNRSSNLFQVPQLRKVAFLGVALLAVGGLGWTFYKFLPQILSFSLPQAVSVGEVNSPAAPISVKTAIAIPQAFKSERTLTGTVEPMESVVLSSRVMGRIRSLLVQEGDLVQAGQLIATIETDDIQAEQRQAQAAIPQAQAAVTVAQLAELAAQSQLSAAIARQDEAQARLSETEAQVDEAHLHQQRMATLREEGVVSQAQLDSANTQVSVLNAKITQIQSQIRQSHAAIAQAQKQVEQARAQVLQAQAQVQEAEALVAHSQANLEQGIVTAPFSGVITRKHTDIGAIAGPGQSLVRLETAERMRFSVEVPESLITQIKLGQSFLIHLDALNREVEGRITQIIPAADAASRNFTVKIGLNPVPGLISGLFGRFKLSEQRLTDDGSFPVLQVPHSAVVQQFGVTGVYQVIDEMAHFQPITIGRADGDRLEVFSGLQAGDRVIVEPSPDLKEGTHLQLES